MIELTESDVKERLVPAFISHDPHFPSHLIDEQTWKVFGQAYLGASEGVLKARGMTDKLGLPRIFVKGVVKALKQREGK